MVDLNEKRVMETLICPYCKRGKALSYGNGGIQSSGCPKCHKIVLWDFDKKIAYKANLRRVG